MGGGRTEKCEVTGVLLRESVLRGTGWADLVLEFLILLMLPVSRNP